MAAKTTSKVQMDPAIKGMARKACKPRKEQYTLPTFDEAILIAMIAELVEKAPGGIVQLVIDLFCGAGGTSEGIEQARFREIKNSMIIAGINHDKKAIYSQSVNHPHAYYTDEDIRFANLVPIVNLVKRLRKLFPQCPIIIWASLECTNHSNAKGGLPRDPDSRTLPWELYRYIQAIDPDGIWIENVKEFKEWGPMMERTVLERGKNKHSLKNPVPAHLEEKFYADKIAKGFVCYCTLEEIKEGKGKKQVVTGIRPEYTPIKDLKGTYFLPWLEKINSYGYHNQYRVLNAADYGAPTNRHRLFIIFMRPGWPITFPHPTHAKNPKAGDLFDPGLKPHVAVKTCLDFSVQGRSVFDDGHVDSLNTWKRVFEGLVKFGAGGKNAYNLRKLTNDLVRIPGKDFNKGGRWELMRIDKMSNSYFLTRYNNNSDGTVNKGASIEDPAPTVLTIPGLGLISTAFIDTIYGHGFASSLEKAAPTVRCKDGMALVDVEYFLYRAYTAGGYMGSIEEPEGTQMTRPKTSLIGIESLNLEVNEEGQLAYMLNPAWFGSVSAIIDPAVTIVARQDKAPIYLVAAKESRFPVAIPVFKDDPAIVVQIKEFMALYNIFDIKKRMLLVPELLQIQSFPPDYYLAGSKTDQKKYIGNAVPPLVARAIAESMYWPTVDYTGKILNLQINQAA